MTGYDQVSERLVSEACAVLGKEREPDDDSRVVMGALTREHDSTPSVFMFVNRTPSGHARYAERVEATAFALTQTGHRGPLNGYDAGRVAEFVRGQRSSLFTSSE